MAENLINFGTDMSSSVHIDNTNTDILILGEGPTEELNDTTLTAEAISPTILTQPNKIFYQVSYLLMLQKYIS